MYNIDTPRYQRHLYQSNYQWQPQPQPQPQPPQTEQLYALAILMAKGNESVAQKNLNNSKKLWKYETVLALTNGDVKTSKDILEYLTIVKAKRLGKSVSQYIKEKQAYKRKQTSLDRKLKESQERVYRERYRLEQSHKRKKQPIRGGVGVKKRFKIHKRSSKRSSKK